MKKSKILTMVTVSAFVLAQAGTAFADEVIIGSETATEQTSSGTSDSGVQVDTPTDSSTEQSQDTGGTGTVIGGDSTLTETPIDGGGVVVDTPTDESSSSTSDSSSSSDTNSGEATQTETSESGNSEEKSDTQTESETSQQNQETGTVEVPTTTGETATVTTDKSQATNNSNVSAQTAYEAGASQVGSTSQVTGQIVRDVTSANSVTLASGVTITDIQSGVATLSDGSSANLTDLGVIENADKTFTATTIDGEQVTLPETGESTVGVIVGLLIILAGLGLGFKDKLKALIDNIKAKFKKK
ncbi:MAG: cell surface protein [Streptococcus gallolyticus]|nr:cell surface protein [Streptococcus gallolyticus]